jgi:hypothetical protein
MPESSYDGAGQWGIMSLEVRECEKKREMYEYVRASMRGSETQRVEME